MPRTALTILAAGAALALGGCGAGPAPTPTLGAAAPPQASAAAQPAAGAPAPAAKRRGRTSRKASRSGARARSQRDRRSTPPRRPRAARPAAVARRARDKRRGAANGAAPAAAATPAAEQPLTGDRSKQELHLAAGAVREYVGLLAAHDPAVCTRSMTLHLVETITRRRGDAALAKCRSDVRNALSTPELVSFGAGRALPGRAYIEYTVRANGVQRTQIVRLLKIGDRYLLDGDGSREASQLG